MVETITEITFVNAYMYLVWDYTGAIWRGVLQLEVTFIDVAKY